MGLRLRAFEFGLIFHGLGFKTSCFSILALKGSDPSLPTPRIHFTSSQRKGAWIAPAMMQRIGVLLQQLQTCYAFLSELQRQKWPHTLNLLDCSGKCFSVTYIYEGHRNSESESTA